MKTKIEFKLYDFILPIKFLYKNQLFNYFGYFEYSNYYWIFSKGFLTPYLKKSYIVDFILWIRNRLRCLIINIKG